MNEIPKRLSPSKETLNLLFARSGNCCAFPGCAHPLIDEEDQFIAQVCHIEAALPGGERYNEESDNESRRKPENLLLLCYQHHIKTNNIDRYPATELRKIKSEHEAQFQSGADRVVPTFEFIERVYYGELQKITDQLSRLGNQMDSIKSDTAEIREDTKTILAAVNEQIAISSGSGGTTVAGSGIYIPQMDAAMTLRSSYRHDLAIEGLKALKDGHWQDLSALERYKLLANLGICYFELGEYEKAARYYLDAFEFQPERLRAITLAASAHVILGSFDIAAELARKALVMEPGNADAYNTLIVAEGGKLDLPSLIALVPLAYRDQVDVALAISNEARKKGMLEEAINWAERGIGFAGIKNVLQGKAYLATLIYDSINYPFDVYNRQVSRDMLNKAKYVVELLDTVWAEVKGTLLAPINTYWLSCRGQAKRIMGNFKGYYADMLECVECNPSLQNLHNLAYAGIAVEEFDRAYTCTVEMEKFAVGEERGQVQMVRAEILYFTEHYTEAIGLLESVTKEVIPDSLMVEMQVLLVAAYKLGGFLEKALVLNDNLILRYPDAIRPYLERALDERRAGRPDKELEALELALSHVNAESSLLDIKTLAAHFFRTGKFAEAIPLYERIADVKIYGPLTKNLLETYFRAGESKKVLNACIDLISRYGPSYELSYMLTDTYLLINDTQAAIQTCLNHLEVYPDDQRVAAKLLQVYERINYFDAIKKILAKFDRIDRTLPTAVQFKIAELFLVAGLPEQFYDQSLICWKRHYGQKECHEYFIFNSVTALRLAGELTDPQLVQDEVAVGLVDDEGKKLTFFITESGKAGIQEEIAAKDPIGKALAGKAVDDEVNISGRRYRITEILHAFNFAKRESYRLMQEKFIDSNSLRVLKKHDSDDPKVAFRELYAILDADGKQRQVVENMYKKTPLPLGAIARGQGENPIKTWNSYIAWDSPGIPVMNGQNEVEVALKKLAENSPIIIDAITLNSVASIGLLSELAAMENPLTVSQSSLNVFHSLIREFETSKGGFTTMGKRNGQYVRSELSAQDITQYLDFIKNLVSWIEQHCEVLPCRPALDMSAQEKLELDDLYGESFAETLLIAGSSDYLLYSEEWTFRSMAYQFYHTDGFNSFMLCQYLVKKEVISMERFHDALKKMIGMNYQGIPVNSSILISLLEKTADPLHPTFQTAIKGLASDLTGFSHAQATCLLFYHDIIRSEVLSSKLQTDHSFFSKVVLTTLQVLFSCYSTAEQVNNSLVEACNTIFRPEHPLTIKILNLIGEAFKRSEKK
ncbi:hypothetical protein ASU31_10535 [Pedobacter ginsenosidimutans]|uniref:PIN domain-containing protein n=1 Tax=Pedobacter ginsenosidimutans TaxID=687842 RepID=A0A0T5VPZ2_9SPHI|nr:tetratricopeptide repeat protein [Pedobacter ginsenosidimutans]KRT15939.1 hypothetical protein ASU31_10535 [Pedobacter ginsenosidimutans]